MRTRVIAEETLAELLGMSGDRKAMYEHYETALAAAEGSVTADDDHLATLRYSLGLALFQDDILDRADVLFGQATTAWQHLRSPKQYFAEVEHAMLRAQQHRCGEAMPMYAHVIAGAAPGVQRMKAQQLGLGDCLSGGRRPRARRELFATVAREGPALPGGDELAKIAAAWLAANGEPLTQTRSMLARSLQPPASCGFRSSEARAEELRKRSRSTRTHTEACYERGASQHDTRPRRCFFQPSRSNQLRGRTTGHRSER